MIFPMLYEQMMLSHDKVGLAEGVIYYIFQCLIADPARKILTQVVF